MLNIDVAQLDNEGIQFSGIITPDIIDLGVIESDEYLEFKDEIEYDLHISSVTEGVLVSGSVSTFAQCDCVRCLETYSHHIDNLQICQFHENVTTSILDIAPQLREDILISLPMKYICSEDCEGIVIEKKAKKKNKELNEEFNNEDDPWQGLDDIVIK